MSKPLGLRPHQQPHIDRIVKAFYESPKELFEELEAITAFFHEFENNFADEDDPRMAFIMGMGSTLTAVIYLLVKELNDVET